MTLSGRDGCCRWLHVLWPLLGCSFVGFTLLGITSTSAYCAYWAQQASAEIETRDFDVSVDGKKAGMVHMTIQRQPDGVTQMRCETDITVKALIVKYRFSYRGQEIWKDRRLLRFDSTADDNGNRYVISAISEPTGVRMRVNNEERIVPSGMWLTTYWCLPDPALRGQVLPIIDADNGQRLDGKLQFVGKEVRVLAGQRCNVQHWRVTGKTTVELWYDELERLVRQEWVEQGHRTTLELIRVRQ